MKNEIGVTPKQIDALMEEICDWLFSVRIHFLAMNTDGLRTSIIINEKDRVDVLMVALDSGWPVNVINIDGETAKIKAAL